MTEKLIIAAVVAALVGGGVLYVKTLNSRLAREQSKVSALTVERDAAREQVLSLTAAQDALKAKEVLANKATANVKAELAKARARVQYVQIPTECPLALEWLVDEIAK